MCCGNLAAIHYLGTCLKMLNKVPIMAAETKQIPALRQFACSKYPTECYNVFHFNGNNQRVRI